MKKAGLWGPAFATSGSGVNAQGCGSGAGESAIVFR
jgi:hypothetical protein